MGQSPNYGIPTVDFGGADQEKNIIDAMNSISGTNPNSAVMKIDAELKSQDTKINKLDSRSPIQNVDARYVSTVDGLDYYEGTNTEIEEYKDKMIILFKPDKTNTGEVVIKINDLENKYVKRIVNSTKENLNKAYIQGSALYYLQYDGTDFNLIDDFSSSIDILIKENKSGTNLFLNPDYAVAQRGATFANVDGMYTFDRHRMDGDGSVKQKASGRGIECTAGTVKLAYTFEDIDYAAIAGQTVTLSYSKNGTVTAESPFTLDTQLLEYMTLTAADTLEWVKLELGETATKFIPPIYADELMRCMRYYEMADMREFAGFDVLRTLGTGAYFMRLYKNPNKRTTPTMTVDPPTSSIIGTYGRLISYHPTAIQHPSSGTAHSAKKEGYVVGLIHSQNIREGTYYSWDNVVSASINMAKIYLDSEIYLDWN